MAKKEIRIHLAADADIAKVRAMNTELARMAMAVGRKNDDLRQATMRAAREYYGLADAADTCASRSVLSAKQIEEAWRKAMSRPAENAERGLKKFEIAAKGALKGIGGAFSSVFEMFLQGGIWGAAAEAVTRVFSWAWNKIKEDAEKAAKRAARAFAEGLDGIRASAEAVEKAFESSVSGIDKSISRFDAMTNSVKELTKAEIELAKQRAIANGMDAASANAAAEDLSAQVDFEAEELRLRNVIALEQKRVDAAKAAEAATAEEVRKATEAKAAAEAEYQKKREEAAEKAAREERFAVTPFTSGAPVTEEDIARAKARGAEKFDESDAGAAAREKVRKAQDVLDGIKTDEKARAAAEEARARIKSAETALDALSMRREAREFAAQNELAAKEDEARKALEAKDAAAAAKRSEAERKAAQDAARERERLDRELHQRRMADLRAEIAEQSKAAAPLRAAAAAARGEFARAFAMFRDPKRAADEIGEEKAYAADLDRLHAEAGRYGGKWRIDELARLMAAGDADGQTAALAEWRKSARFSPQVEAMVRASAAERAKTTAEDELRKIEANTAGLAEKLDELIGMKGGE